MEGLCRLANEGADEVKNHKQLVLFEFGKHGYQFGQDHGGVIGLYIFHFSLLYYCAFGINIV
nr:MAG TPA: hypothetical protein [Caudoviricetes sp.]